MTMMKDPGSGLHLPSQFIDQKVALKKVIDDVVDDAVNRSSHIKDTYFLTIHAKFNPNNQFTVGKPKLTYKIPQFMSNTFVFWVNQSREICELLWIVPPKKPGEKKLRVEFNKEGVAYLQAKGAMPSSSA